MGTRTVGYVRCSTVGQAEEGVTLDAQKSKIRAYCELHDLELVEIVEDAGLSGKSIAGRPGIQRVLDMVKTGNVDNVVIFKLDRLARNLKEACEIAELLKRKKAGLHSISEKIDTGSATGKLFYQILSALNEWERELISERTRGAMDHKRTNGERVSRHAPYGFMFDNTDMVVSCEAEQGVISKIRQLHHEGYSIRGIVEHLTNHGIMNRKGRPFGKTQVHAVLKRAA
jgi:DNA invertase Pin-like site-specific DNA recombinase